MLGGNALAFTAVAVLVTMVFFARHVSGAETKENLKNPSKPGLNILPEGSSEDNGPKKSTLSGSFSKRLFSDPKINGRDNAIHKMTKYTKFIKGIDSGGLHINVYGAYMMQNFAFISNAVKVLKHAAEIMELKGELEYAQSYRAEVRLYSYKYFKTMVRDWGLKDTESVTLGHATQEYVTLLTYVAEHHPKYLAVAMLPHTMLSRWVADDLFKSALTRDNLYFGWIEGNKSREPGYQSSLEKFVDKKFSTQDEYLKAAGIFCRGMWYELNFFREVGRESRKSIPDFCKIME